MMSIREIASLRFEVQMLTYVREKREKWVPRTQQESKMTIGAQKESKESDLNAEQGSGKYTELPP